MKKEILDLSKIPITFGDLISEKYREL